MLNIKNPRAHELAATLSQITGESLTDTVIHSLENELARRRQAGASESAQALMAFLAEVKRDVPQTFLDAQDPTDWLYDDDGLPA